MRGADAPTTPREVPWQLRFAYARNALVSRQKTLKVPWVRKMSAAAALGRAERSTLNLRAACTCGRGATSCRRARRRSCGVPWRRRSPSDGAAAGCRCVARRKCGQVMRGLPCHGGGAIRSMRSGEECAMACGGRAAPRCFGRGPGMLVWQVLNAGMRGRCGMRRPSLMQKMRPGKDGAWRCSNPINPTRRRRARSWRHARWSRWALRSSLCSSGRAT